LFSKRAGTKGKSILAREKTDAGNAMCFRGKSRSREIGQKRFKNKNSATPTTAGGQLGQLQKKKKTKNFTKGKEGEQNGISRIENQAPIQDKTWNVATLCE